MTTLPKTLGLAALILASMLVGCSPYGDLCAREMDCRNGNDADYDVCMLDYERRDDLSSVYGCGDKWDSYLDCMDRNASCNGGKWNDNNDCNSARSNFNDCID